MKALAIASLIAFTLAGAMAHEFVRDGDIGALMHLEPDDSVLAGKATSVLFETTRRGGTALSEADCACQVSLYAGAIKAGAKALASLPAKDGPAGKLSATLTFPKEGPYTLALDGKPRKAGDFKPFHLEWTLRAEAAPHDHAH